MYQLISPQTIFQYFGDDDKEMLQEMIQIILDSNLKDLKRHYDAIVFVSYLTVQPERDSIDTYINEMTSQLVDENTELWFTGRQVEFIQKENLSDKISIFTSISELVSLL